VIVQISYAVHVARATGWQRSRRAATFCLRRAVYDGHGRKAFEGKSQASLIAAIMSADPAPISALQPVAPAALDRVIRKCLEKDPDDRWHSAKDLADELSWIGRAEPASSSQRPLAVEPALQPARTGRGRDACRILAGVLVRTVCHACDRTPWASPTRRRSQFGRRQLSARLTMEGVAGQDCHLARWPLHATAMAADVSGLLRARIR
jgi:hypothetical protein